MDVKQEAVRYLLESHIMFNTLSSSEKLALEPLFEVHTWEMDNQIVKQGEPMDGMYYIFSGVVRLKKSTGSARESVGKLGKESTFGEMSLLKEGVWQTDFIAADKITAMVLSAEKVRNILGQFPEMAKTLKKQIGLIEVSQRLRGMLGTAEYKQDVFNSIVKGIGVKRIPTDKFVFNQGDDDPRLYYLEQGSVELIRKTVSGEKVVVDKVLRSHLIGEEGALPDVGDGGIQPFSARAVSDVVVLVIPQAAVQKILQINPELFERLRLRAKSLRGKEVSELDVRKRAEGVDLRIKLADAVTEEEFLAQAKKKVIKKFSHIKQRDETDCAAACLTMIINHYGKDFTLGQIRELSDLGVENASPMQIITAAERVGFHSKAYGLKYEDLMILNMPGIVGWEGYHYAVLFKVTKKEVHLADPLEGIIKISRDKFLEGWTRVPQTDEVTDVRGVFIAMDPTQKFIEIEPPKQPIMHFVNMMLPYKKYFGEALLAALTINLLGLASPLFIQTIVDTVVVHHDVGLLNMMLAGMVMVAVFKTASVTVQSLLLAHTTARIDLRMMSEFYRHILSLPMNFFLTRNKGEILARFGENSKIRAIIAGSTITIVLNTLMVVIYFLMMFTYNNKLTIVVIIFIPFYIFITLYFTPRIKAIAQQIFLTGSQQQSYLIESLNGIESIKATANEYFARSRWENCFVENVNMGYRQAKIALVSRSLNELVGLAITTSVLWIGANEVMESNMTIGELMGFNMLMGLVIGPCLQMVGLWNNFQEIRIAIDRVSDVLNVKPEQDQAISPDKIPATLDDCKGRIEFQKINFSYVANEKENYIMRDFELVIEQGQRVAFVGASGCGKSTIAKMILGFNVPKSGLCTIDGKDITALDMDSLRRNIGVVLQDSFIFSGTVAQNIALGDPEPDMQAVKEASHLSGADEFITNYPLGYMTLIGEKGMGISGGQRQRMCIARALYRKPKIMIFDEATSALDNESEARILENMGDILTGKTSISIAHRLSTIIDSDMICFIKDGKVAEKGTHDELIDPVWVRKKGYTGLYYGLAKSQFDLPDLDMDKIDD